MTANKTDEAVLNEAMANVSAGRMDEAISSLRTAIENGASNPALLHNLSILLARKGEISESYDFAHRVVAGSPDLADGWLHLGNLSAARGKVEGAIEAFRKVTELAPGNGGGWRNLGNLLARQSRYEEAIPALTHATILTPKDGNLLAALALTFRKSGQLDKAIEIYRKVLKIDPGNVAAHSNLLVALQYSPQATAKELLRSHRAWDEQHGSGVYGIREVRPENPDPDRPLKIGYVSGDFRAHPVGYFLHGVLGAHNPANVETICFSDTTSQDALTETLRKNTNRWIDTRSLSTGDFVRAVQSAGVDILVDLAGHFTRNRLTAFAMRAAPVQATWAGYVGSTGLAAMDWLIADHQHIPDGLESDGLESCVTERVIRLPRGYVCFEPPANAPPIGPAPHLANGMITFGCFNNFIKINEDVVSAWADILNRVPNSVLLMATADLDQPGIRDRYYTLFSAQGIKPERLRLKGWQPRKDLLAAYNEIDIALDPFPYSGGVTTLESLWMGVPVVTMPGNRFASRHSVSHLAAAGLPEFIASGRDAYIEIAANLATDPARLNEYRATLRDRLKTLPLYNGTLFTPYLEKAFRIMWQDACQGRQNKGPRLIDVPGD